MPISISSNNHRLNSSVAKFNLALSNYLSLNLKLLKIEQYINIVAFQVLKNIIEICHRLQIIIITLYIF